jgi:hypothetical protein
MLGESCFCILNKVSSTRDLDFHLTLLPTNEFIAQVGKKTHRETADIIDES